MAESLRTVAVLNGLVDTIDMLRIALEHAGYRVVDAQARDVRLGTLDLAAFVQAHGVDVVLYDIAIPYRENWETVERCRATPPLDRMPFVLTTTNARVLEGLVGATGVLEIVGKPYDLAAIVAAIDRAAGVTRKTGRPRP